jgi:hypothetical protein
MMSLHRRFRLPTARMSRLIALALQSGCNDYHKEEGSGEEGHADRCAQTIHIFVQQPSLNRRL